MLQTLWDSLQQVIRIALYAGAGALVSAGVVDEATSLQLAGAALALITGIWTAYWNRKQVMTVDGLEAASKSASSPVSGAMAVEAKAVKA
jgi:hypothetical protein